MEVQNFASELLGSLKDKENKVSEEGAQEKAAGLLRESCSIPICVTTNDGPSASQSSGLEPLSPSKRFTAGGQLQQGGLSLDILDTPQRRQATLEREAKQQICFDYTKGVCKRGAACKYSHDVEEIVRVNSQERGVCFDFLRNCCQRGLLCRFSHDLSSIVMQDQVQKPGRKNAPICYDFVKGVCKRDDCRYSHDIFSIIRGRNAKPSVPTQICYDFTRGKCNRGGACRYSHELNPDSMAAFSGDAVAALAAQHAQLAAVAAVEATRRQSAPGCMQPAAPESLAALLGGLNNPQSHRGNPGDGSVSQAALALQLQSQWLLQLQAANLLQPRAQGLGGWDHLRQGPWPAAGPDPRRHTYDGAQRPLGDDFMHQLQELCIRQAVEDEQVKLAAGDMQKELLGPHDSLSSESTIGANWHAPGQLNLSRGASLELPHHNRLPLATGLLDTRPSVASSLSERQASLRHLDTGAGASLAAPQQQPRVPFMLRPVQSGPVLGGGNNPDLMWRPVAGPRHLSIGGPGPVGPSTSDALPQVGAGGTLASISFEDRPQSVGRDQLALFQEIWRQ